MKERVFWSYEDLGVFVLLVALLTLTLRALVRFGVLPRSELVQPDDSLQLGIVSVLIVGLFAILKLRRPKHLLTSLGWRPSASLSAHRSTTGRWSFALYTRQAPKWISRTFH